jgi:hypothetical protein
MSGKEVPMTDQDQGYAQGDDEPFGFVDDDEEEGEELEEDILGSRDYAEADRYGMTQEEQRRGTPLNMELAAEEPEVWEDDGGPGPGDPVPDEPAEPRDLEGGGPAAEDEPPRG